MRVSRVIVPLLLLAGTLVAVPVTATAAPTAPHPLGVGRYVPVAPTRVVDTRGGGSLGQGAVLEVDFSAQLPNVVVAAVVLNVTVVNSTMPGYITAYPAGAPRPTTSSLNHRAQETRANSVTVALPASAANQNVDFYNNAGTTDLIVDLFGYYVGSTTDPASSSSYYPLGNPVRAFDSRALGGGGPLSAGASHTVQRAFSVDGSAYIGVRAAAITVTAVNPRAAGYLRAWNGDPNAVPTVSTLNFARGQTIPNFAIVPVKCVNPPTCSTFSFAVSNNFSPATDVVVDIVGIYANAGQPGATYFSPTTPKRVVDTRIGQGFGKLGASGTGAAAIGNGFVKPTAANLNITSVGPTAASTYLTVYADGQTRPTSSNLNPVAGETASDAAQPLLSGLGRFRVFNANGSTNVVVDLTGAFLQD